MYPEELNSRSHGTDVAGTHNTVFTKFAKTGKRFLLSLYQVSGFSVSAIRSSPL